MGKNKLRIGLYPGTFDPITHGHFEIICRAAKLVDKLVVGVAKSPGKSPLFDTRSRVKFVKNEIKPLTEEKGLDIEVKPFDNLLLHYAQEVGANTIIRGLRAVSDFEYEFQMAGMNHRMSKKIETVFLMASDKHQFVSSSFVKEIAVLGGDVSSFVSPTILEALNKRFDTAQGRNKVKREIRD